jgi:hypothetical protein
MARPSPCPDDITHVSPRYHQLTITGRPAGKTNAENDRGQAPLSSHASELVPNDQGQGERAQDITDRGIRLVVSAPQVWRWLAATDARSDGIDVVVVLRRSAVSSFTDGFRPPGPRETSRFRRTTKKLYRNIDTAAPTISYD